MTLFSGTHRLLLAVLLIPEINPFALTITGLQGARSRIWPAGQRLSLDRT
jgi:hypothetical protein